MRILWILTVVTCLWQLCGCTTATSGVATIGLRIQYGDIKKAERESKDKVVINESDAYFIGTTFMCDHCGLPIPYKNAYPKRRDAQLIGTFDYREDAKENKMYVNIGKEEEFDIVRSEHGDKYTIQRKRRLWYGYPAQLLQVVAVPVDFALSVVQTTLVLVAYPFMR